MRYFLVGGLATLVDPLLFAVLVKGLDFAWLGSVAFSFCVATLVNYVFSVRHVFKSGVRFGKRHERILIFNASSIWLLINQAAQGMLIEVGCIEVLLPKVAATALVFFWNYEARHHFIFCETVK